jgi:hypothetical protein
VAFEDNEADEEIDHWTPIALDRLVAAGKIREIDRERVTFIVRTIVHPPEREDAPRRKDRASDLLPGPFSFGGAERGRPRAGPFLFVVGFGRSAVPPLGIGDGCSADHVPGDREGIFHGPNVAKDALKRLPRNQEATAFCPYCKSEHK